jgi:CRP-like cAMP-binding protein
VTTVELIRAVRTHPIWRDASEQSIRALTAIVRDVKLHPGDAVLSAGEPAEALHLLVEGAVRVFYPATDESAEITVKLFWAPAAFGDAESILRVRWAETVQALTPARVLVAPALPYFRLMQKEPSVCFRQYWDVARRFGVAIRSERASNLDDLRDRIVAILVAYANHFGVKRSDGVLIDFALTQDEIGKQVGANRRSVVSVLGALYEKKLLARAGRRFLVADVDALLATSRGPAPDLSFKTDDRPWAELARNPAR